VLEQHAFRERATAFWNLINSATARDHTRIGQ
jgi:hypothetical protein